MNILTTSGQSECVMTDGSQHTHTQPLPFVCLTKKRRIQEHHFGVECFMTNLFGVRANSNINKLTTNNDVGAV